MASTASPLPPPPQVQVTPVDLMLMAAANATNGQHPDIVAGVASTSSSVSDAVQNSQAAAQLASTQNAIQQLQNETPHNQQQVWDGLSQQQQQQFKSAGYKPPAAHRSLWGDITHGIGDVVHDVTHNGAVGDVLNALGSPLRAVQHGERTLFDLANTAQISSPNTGAEWGDFFKEITKPEDWARAWDETTKGQQYIMPQVKTQVLNTYGQQTYDLALQLAQGKTAQELIKNAPQATQQQLYQQITDPKTQQALTALNAGHLTVGHMLLTPGFIARHPDVGNKLSGVVDGVMDWFGDPLNVAGDATGAWKAVRYSIHNGDDVQRLFDKLPAVSDKFQRIASAVADNNYDRLLNENKDLKMAAQELFAEHADTQEKVLAYFKRVADFANIAEGTPTNAVGEFQASLPHLTRAGQARLWAKGKMMDTIDWAAEKNIHIPTQDGDLATSASTLDKLVYPIGRFARAALTLEPGTRVFRITDPDAVNVLRDVGLRFLDRKLVNDYLVAFARDTDINSRMKTFRAMLLNMGHAAGLDRDPEFWKMWTDKYITGSHLYGYGDTMTIDGADQHYGFLKSHMAEAATIPDFREMYLQARKGIVTKAATDGMNAAWIDRFMGLWRPLTLAHLGFATRVGGEEAAAFLLRHGPLAYMRGAAGRTLVKTAMRQRGEIADRTGDDIVESAAAESYNRLAGHLPSKIQDTIHTTRDLLKEYVIDQTNRAMANVATKLTSQQYRDGVEAMVARGVFDHGGPFDRYVTAMHGYDMGDVDGREYIKIQDGTKMVNAVLQTKGGFKSYRNTDELFWHMYHYQLHSVANDDWGREALLRGPRDTKPTAQYAVRIRRVADKLQSDPKWREEALRSKQNRAGQLVGRDITERAAAEDHAKTIISNVDRLTKFKDSDGNYQEIPGLIDHMLKNGKPPTLAALQEIPLSHLPYDVAGPKTELVKIGAGNIRKATDTLFSKIIGPQINWISRKPMFIHNYTAARIEYTRMLRNSGLGDETKAQLIHDNSMNAALKNTIAYVHNPQMRSEMSMITRNLAPFWFAQEQFYKRWAKTFSYSPAAFRKAQLLSQGLRHSGIVHTDPETGQEYFVYPGSGLVQQVLVDALGRIGINAEIPVQAGLTGQVNMLNPAIQRIGAPNFGPLLVVPLNGLKTLDPHMTHAINAIEGSTAASSGFLKAILPTTLTRTLEVAFPNAINSAQYASAQMQAIQAMEATGHGIGTPAIVQVASTSIPNPHPGDYVPISATSNNVYQADGTWRVNSAETLQHYLDRAKNWARVFMLTRLIYGFAAPAAPENQFNPNNLHSDLLTLMNDMPVDEAMTTFLAMHPDADAETVFQTQTPGGAFLPATKAAMKFLDTHPQLEENYGAAAPYFIPQADTAGKFNMDAYMEQMAKGWRQRKSPSQYYQQIMYQTAAQEYYKVEAVKNQMLASHAAPTRWISDQWTQYSEQFMLANPVFASLYGSGQTGGTLPGTAGAGQLGRMQIMEDVGAAINNGVAPNNTQTAALAELYQTWQIWQEMTNTYGNPNKPTISIQTKDLYDQQYAQFLEQFEKENPGVQPLIQRAIAPDLSYALDQLAQQGTAVAL